MNGEDIVFQTVTGFVVLAAIVCVVFFVSGFLSLFLMQPVTVLLGVVTVLGIFLARLSA
jgi:hypothetical protein